MKMVIDIKETLEIINFKDLEDSNLFQELYTKVHLKMDNSMEKVLK